MKALVVTYGFIGDILFSTSIANTLKNQGFETIDYIIGFPQVFHLLLEDPNINNVFMSDFPGPHCKYDMSVETSYDKVFKIGQMSFKKPPPIEMHEQCGLVTNNSEYHIHTNSKVDSIVSDWFQELDSDKKTLCYLSNWEERSFLFTKEQYNAGIDHPNQTGYGGKRRNIDFILKTLSEKYNLIEVGFPSGTSQFQTINISPDNKKSILVEASVIKKCDYFIGSEGGLYNLAAGLSTKTIITGDFIAQLYGRNGSVRRTNMPKLGANFYFPNKQHSVLNPFYTDEEVLNSMINLIDNNEKEIYDWGLL